MLLADDNEDVRLVLKKGLERDGRFEVLEEVADGEQALRAVQEHAIDVVLMDVSMPVLDGVEALKEMKSRHDGNVKVVLMSGMDDNLIRDQVARAQIDGFFKKGASIAVLIKTLEDLFPDL